jgi:hypothetical protein
MGFVGYAGWLHEIVASITARTHPRMTVRKPFVNLSDLMLHLHDFVDRLNSQRYLVALLLKTTPLQM